VNYCHKGLNSGELMLAWVTAQSLFQSKGLFGIAEHHGQENLAQSFADGARV